MKTVTNSAGGTDKYVFVPAAHLPLLAPARQIFGALGLTPLTEPVLAAIKTVLRLLVDMGYTDRENLNPEVPVKFSLITPPARIIETIAQVPGALGTRGEQPHHRSWVAPHVDPGAGRSHDCADELTLDQREDAASGAARVANEHRPAQPGAATPEQQTQRRRRLRPARPSADPAPVSPLSNSGPTLGEVIEDGNKATPNTTSSKTTSPKKNLFTQLADTFKGFLTPKKKPASTTPSSGPNDPTPSGSTSQGQSEGPTSNAA